MWLGLSFILDKLVEVGTRKMCVPGSVNGCDLEWDATCACCSLWLAPWMVIRILCGASGVAIAAYWTWVPYTGAFQLFSEVYADVL